MAGDRLPSRGVRRRLGGVAALRRNAVAGARARRHSANTASLPCCRGRRGTFLGWSVDAQQWRPLGRDATRGWRTRCVHSEHVCRWVLPCHGVRFRLSRLALAATPATGRRDIIAPHGAIYLSKEEEHYKHIGKNY